MHAKKTVIVTGASQVIGAAVVQAFLDHGYNVVAMFPGPGSLLQRILLSSMETSVTRRRPRR